jgi:hypothetical protein
MKKNSYRNMMRNLANILLPFLANFSGRMPCIEVGDSVVAKASTAFHNIFVLGMHQIFGDIPAFFYTGTRYPAGYRI